MSRGPRPRSMTNVVFRGPPRVPAHTYVRARRGLRACLFARVLVLPTFAAPPPRPRQRALSVEAGGERDEVVERGGVRQRVDARGLLRRGAHQDPLDGHLEDLAG